MRYASLVVAALLGLSLCSGWLKPAITGDDVQRQAQEILTAEGTAQTGMPAIPNFRERKLLKDIYELRDQEGLTTYTYLWNEFNGRLVFLGESIGYGIPYSTQYSAPETVKRYRIPRVPGVAGSGRYGVERLPQSEPNGLFTPGSAEGTRVLLKDPHGKSVKPVYVEPRIVVSPFELQ